MARKQSPLALKRGPKKLHTSMLLKRIEALKRKKKRRMVLPTSRMWPSQVEAGVEALVSCLWMDPTTGTRRLIYDSDHEKVVRAVFKACIQARVERAKVLKRRADKRVTKEQEPDAAPQS